MRLAVVCLALIAAQALALDAVSQRGLASGRGRGALEPGEAGDEPTAPTEKAFSSFPLLDESLDAAATGAGNFDPATGPEGLDEFPLTLENADEGEAQASGVLKAVRAVESQLADQQRTLDGVFSASQQRCKDDAVALAQQLALVKDAIKQKEEHRVRTHHLLDQPAQFIKLNKQALHNMEKEHEAAKAALKEQEQLSLEHAGAVNTALEAAKRAIGVLDDARDTRSKIRATPDLTTALVELTQGKALSRAGLRTARAQLQRALQGETPLEAEVHAEQQEKELKSELDERNEALNNADGDLKRAEEAADRSKERLQRVRHQAEQLEKEVAKEASSLGELSTLVGGDDGEQSATAAAKRVADQQLAKAQKSVQQAERFVKEEQGAKDRAWEAAHSVESDMDRVHKHRIAMIAESDHLVRNLRAALESVKERLGVEHQTVEMQLHRAKSRYAEIEARIKHEAPALREAIRRLESARDAQHGTEDRLDVRTKELREQLTHVKEQFSGLAARCEEDASQYARRTERRTEQRAQMRVLAQHLEVQLAAIQRSIAAAHAAQDVRDMHGRMKAQALYHGLRNDAELDAAAFEGASEVVEQGEGASPSATGGFGMDGIGAPTGLYAAALHDVEKRHESAEHALRVRANLAHRDDQSIQNAAEAALRAARDMHVLLDKDLKLKKAYAEAKAMDVVKSRKEVAEALKHEKEMQATLNGAEEFVAEKKKERDEELEKVKAEIKVVEGEAEEPKFDRVTGEIQLPEGAPDAVRLATINDLITAAVEMPEYPEAEGSGSGSGALRGAGSGSGSGGLTPFEAVIKAYQPKLGAYEKAVTRLEGIRQTAQKATYDARVAEQNAGEALGKSRLAVRVTESAKKTLRKNKESWKALAEYAKEVLGVPMPDLEPRAPCTNHTEDCTARSENGEAAKVLSEELRKKHALLLRREQVLREIEHRVAEARSNRVARTAAEGDARPLKTVATTAASKTKDELDSISKEVDRVKEYIADADAEDMTTGTKATMDAGEAAVRGSEEAVANVSGDYSHSADKTIKEMESTVAPRDDAADGDEIGTLESSVQSKKEELEVARKELEQDRSSLAAASRAAEEAQQSRYHAAFLRAEEVRQQSEKAAGSAEARVNALEADLSQLQARLEELKERRQQEAEQEEAEAADEAEEEETQAEQKEETNEPVDQGRPTLPAVDTMSKVEAEQRRAMELTRKADLEAQAWSKGSAQA